MAHPTDPREDAPTEWLSPVLYRQLCDAVDSALTLPAESREAVLAARLGDDPRLLSEARALLASYEASPRTVVTDVPPVSPQSGTGAIPGIGAAAADADGTQQVPAPATSWEPAAGGARQSSGTVALPASPVYGAITAPFDGVDGSRSGSHAAAEWDDTPIALPRAAPPSGATAAPRDAPRDLGGGREPLPAAYAPPSTPAAPPVAPLFARRDTPPLGSPSLSPGAVPMVAASVIAPVPVPAPAPVPDLRAVAERPAAWQPEGAPVPVRPAAGGRRMAPLFGIVVLVVLAVALAGAIWFWLVADQARRTAEANLALATRRLALSERRFDVVRQLGTRLAEVDNLLAVTEDGGARTARAVLVRTWLQYLQDLQRASGGTDRDLLLEVARAYTQVAASQGGGGRALGDFGGAAKTLQIGIRLLEYLDRTARQPEPAILRELTRSQVALGDALRGAEDAAASAEQYRKALATAERLGSIGGNEADARRDIASIRQRLQAAPPPPAP